MGSHRAAPTGPHSRRGRTHGSHTGSTPRPHSRQGGAGLTAIPYHAIQIPVLVLCVPVDVQGQLTRTQRGRVRPRQTHGPCDLHKGSSPAPAPPSTERYLKEGPAKPPDPAPARQVEDRAEVLLTDLSLVTLVARPSAIRLFSRSRRPSTAPGL